MNGATVWLRYIKEPHGPTYALAVFTTAEAAKGSIEGEREWVPAGDGWLEEHRDLTAHWVIEPYVLDAALEPTA